MAQLFAILLIAYVYGFILLMSYAVVNEYDEKDL